MTSADLPYDTDIPDDGADIPEDPNEAFRANAMKITRINSVNQVIFQSPRYLVCDSQPETKSRLSIMLMAAISLALIHCDCNGVGINDGKYKRKVINISNDKNSKKDDDDDDDDDHHQVKSMVNLVDDIAANALKSMVAGEELDTAASLGEQLRHKRHAFDDQHHAFCDH